MAIERVSVPVTTKMNTRDRAIEISHNERKKIITEWEKRRIQADPFKVDPAFLDRAQTNIQLIREKIRELSAFHWFMDPRAVQGDAPILAERLLAEGMDMDGGVTKKGGKWIADKAIVALGSEIDDAMRATDVFAMVMDEDDERVGLPLAIDVTTSEMQMSMKVMRDLERLGNERFSKVFWTDPQKVDDEASFDIPDEGEVDATHMSILLPREQVFAFFHPETEPLEAGRVMQTLGDSVRLQIRRNLQMQITRLVEEASGRAEMLSLNARTPLLSAMGSEEDLLQRAHECINTRTRLSLYRQRVLDRLARQLLVFRSIPAIRSTLLDAEKTTKASIGSVGIVFPLLEANYKKAA